MTTEIPRPEHPDLPNNDPLATVSGSEMEKEALGQYIAKLVELAHESGFNAGRQAAADYVAAEYLTITTSNVHIARTRDGTNRWFEDQRLADLRKIVKALMEQR